MTQSDERTNPPTLSLVPEAPRALRDELIDAGDGDAVAGMRVELAEARRVEADAEGALVAARQKHLDLQESDRTPRWRVVEAAEQAKSAQRALEVAAAQREAVQARTLRAEDAGHDASPSGRLLRFSGVEEFVCEFAWPAWEHQLAPKVEPRWCAQWWAHTSAVVAFEALWESFEVARLEPPPSMAAWLRDFLWPFMRELTQVEGPFSRCSPSQHQDAPDLPNKAAPAGFFMTYPSESRALREVETGGAGA